MQALNANNPAAIPACPRRMTGKKTSQTKGTERIGNRDQVSLPEMDRPRITGTSPHQKRQRKQEGKPSPVLALFFVIFPGACMVKIHHHASGSETGGSPFQ